MVVRTLLNRLRNSFRKSNHRKRLVSRRLPGDSVENLEVRQLLTVNFAFQYQGTINANGFGFEDPILGLSRRAALTGAASQLGAMFENTGTITVDVVSTNDPQSATLASAGSELILGNQTSPFGGNEVVRTKVLTAVDLNGTLADATLDVNWANNFEISADPADVDMTEFDFYSTITHELVHALGFSSQISQNGNDVFGTVPGQQGTWSRFDGFLTDSVGTSVLDFNGVLNANTWNTQSVGGSSVNGAGLFFNGPIARAANNGQRVGLFTPTTWSDGSSVSHLDDANPAYAGAIMLSTSVAGTTARSLTAIEEGILMDLGYTLAGNVVVTPQIGLTVSDLGTTTTFDVSLGRQPTSDVILTVTSNDNSEVTVSTTALVFTRNNWNTPQTITLTGVSDGIQDGNQLSVVTVAVDDPNSANEFDPVNDIRLSVTSTDDDGTIPGKPVFTSPGQTPTVPNPLFEWNPVANGRRYTLQITNFFTGALVREVTDLAIPRHTFQTPFVNGVYRATAVGFNASGTPGPISDPLIFAIGEVAIPGAPTLISPLQGSVVQTNTPSIEWRVPTGASEYELYIRADGVVTIYRTPGVDIGPGLRAFSPPVALKEGFNSVWIRAFNPFGVSGPWSAALGFTVDAVIAPGRPVITAPIVTTTTNAFPKFEWVAANAVSYELWVSELPGGASKVTSPTRVIHVTNFSGTSYTHFSPLNNALHRVWVRSVNLAGEKSEWSAFEQFTVNVPLPQFPVLAQVGETQNQQPRISWSSAAGDTFNSDTTFNLWVNNLTTGETRVIIANGLKGTSYTPTSPLKQGRYAVWVQSVSAVGTKSAWSARMVMNIDQPAPGRSNITRPVAPANSAVIATDKPTLVWDAVPGAATYELWVNHRDSNKVRIIHELGLTGTTFTPQVGLPQGAFTGWVRAYNAAGEVGAWSTPFSFSLDVPTPTVPVITGPATNAVGSVNDSSPTITWTASVAAASYELQVDLVSNGKRVIDETNILFTNFTVPFKLLETSYQTRVRAVNSAGERSAWSALSIFRIDVPNATTPIAIGPTGTVTKNEVTFQWQHTSGNLKYEILVRDLLKNEDVLIQKFTFELELNQSRAVATENLANGTYRFWVRAFNSQGTASSWSNSLSFTVDNRVSALESEAPLDGQLQIILTSLRVADRDAHDSVADTIPVNTYEARRQISDRDQTENAAERESNQPAAPDVDLFLQAVMSQFADPEDSENLGASI